MAEKQREVYTFHKIRARCEGPDPAAWRAFLSFYSPLYVQLLKIYLPAEDAAPRVWERTLGALSANRFERFHATPDKSEREFLADVRALLLDQATAEAPAPPVDPSSAGAIDSARVGKLLEGLPLLHQEMLFLKLAGYRDATLEDVFRIAPRVAEKAFERLQPDLASPRNPERDRCAWPAQWLALLAQARGASTDKCPEPSQFMRIHDGQVSWYEKEPVEKHVVGCLHCLELWTALREVAYWRHAAPAVPDGDIERFLRFLPVNAAAATGKSLLRRLFG